MVRIVGIALASLALAGCAMDWGKGYAQYKDDELDRPVKPMRFRCESTGGDQRYCSVDTRAGVTLVKQLSRTPCLQGRNWGYDRFGVWVTYGCRAEFRTGKADVDKVGLLRESLGVARCESEDFQRKECPVRIEQGASVLKQLSDSPCEEGQSWGWNPQGLWVDKGCGAEFRVR